MNLPVVPTRLLLEEEFAEPFGAEIAGDAESIRTMRLGDAVRDPCVLSPVAVGVVHFQLQDATPSGGSELPSRIIPMKASARNDRPRLAFSLISPR